MIELTETGFIEVKIGDVTQQLDLLRTNNAIAEIQDKKLPPTEELDAIAAYIVAIGFQQVSHSTARDFTNSIIEERKKREGKSAPVQSNSESPN